MPYYAVIIIDLLLYLKLIFKYGNYSISSDAGSIFMYKWSFQDTRMIAFDSESHQLDIIIYDLI